MLMNLVLPALAAATLLQGASPELIEEFDASTTRTGFVKLLMTPAEVLGEAAAERLNPILLATEPVEWRVYVPRDYRPQEPPGILVFVSSIDRGGIPEQWQPLMDEHNLIWIGASHAGSSAPVQERVLKSILAPRAIDRKYKVDTERVYIGGFADGGMVANLVQTAEPGVFKGGMYVCGALFWGDDEPAKLAAIRQNRHVFIRGCFDPKEREIQRIHAQYKEAGVEDSALINIPTRRQSLPIARYIADAIRYLDSEETVLAD